MINNTEHLSSVSALKNSPRAVAFSQISSLVTTQHDFYYRVQFYLQEQ